MAHNADKKKRPGSKWQRHLLEYARRLELAGEATEGQRVEPDEVSLEEALLDGPRVDPAKAPTRAERDAINKAVDALAKNGLVTLEKKWGRRPARSSYHLEPEGRRIASGFVAENRASPEAPVRFSSLYEAATQERRRRTATLQDPDFMADLQADLFRVNLLGPNERRREPASAIERAALDVFVAFAARQTQIDVKRARTDYYEKKIAKRRDELSAQIRARKRRLAKEQADPQDTTDDPQN